MHRMDLLPVLASQYRPPFRPGDFEKWAAENSLLLDDPLA